MKDISRIKEIMGITEEQRPVTAPINISALVKLLELLVKQNPETTFYGVQYDSAEMDKIIKATKYIGVTEDETDLRDFLVAFTELNSDLIDGEDFNVDNYRIPEKKNFEWEGEENYHANVSNYYKGEIEAYDEESPEHWLNVGDWDVWNGENTGREEHDSWDVEQQIADIKEKPRQTESVTLKEQSEGGNPLVNTEGLLKVIQFTLQNHKDVSFDNLSPQNPFLDNVFTNLKLLGIKNVSVNAVDDYVFTFMKDNASLLDSGNFNSEEYIIPKKKKFEWDGVEKYWAWKADYYTGELEGYSEDYILNLFDNYDLTIDDGRFIDSEINDVKDSEQSIDNFKEVPFNESVNEQEEPKVDLDTYEAPFTSEDFMNYVESEWDLEMLNLLMGIISKRKKFLEDVLAKAEPRTVVKGFKRFEESKTTKNLRLLQELLKK